MDASFFTFSSLSLLLLLLPGLFVSSFFLFTPCWRSGETRRYNLTLVCAAQIAGVRSLPDVREVVGCDWAAQVPVRDRSGHRLPRVGSVFDEQPVGLRCRCGVLR